MSLVDSLLGAIVKLDGDSLVLHTGEKPYVVTSSSAMNAFRGPLAWGQVELSTKALTVAAVTSMLQQLFTDEERQVLDEMGAVEHLIPASDERPGFTVVAARGGDDIWVEIRPVRPAAGAPDAVPEPVEEAESSLAVEPHTVGTAPEVGHGPTVEVVHEVEQEQPDAAAVAALLASAGLARGEAGAGHGPSESAPRDVQPETGALLEEELSRLAAAREEADRMEANAREHAARVESLREEAVRLEASRDETLRATAAARDEAVRMEAEARAAAETSEAAARAEATRLEALRSETARLDEVREEETRLAAAVREQAARLEALRQEATQLEEARAEAVRVEAAAREEAERVEALRQEAERLQAAREEAARVEAAARDQAERVSALRAEAARLDSAREEAAQAIAAVQEAAARVQALRDEAERLEAARAEAELVQAAARQEAARVQALREEASRLEAASAEAERIEAAVRHEAERVEALRREAERLDDARAEAARVEAEAREQDARLLMLREEAARLDAAREEAARVEAAARAEAARVEALREEAARLEAAREEAARVEAAARAEAARVEALREEAARLDAAREEAVRVESIAREEATRIQALRSEAARLEAAAREDASRNADAARAQHAALDAARREMAELTDAVRAHERRLEEVQNAAADAENRRTEAERVELERVEALREAQRLEHGRLEELRAEAVRLEVIRRDEEALLHAAREDASRLQAEREEALTLERARREGEDRLQAVVAAIDLGDRGAVSSGPAPDAVRPSVVRAGEPTPAVTAPATPELTGAATVESAQAPDGEARLAPVLPLVRGLREQPTGVSMSGGSTAPDLDRLLRIAAARGASGLYLVSRSHPAVRVDGDMQPLDGEEPLAAADVEAFMLALAPEPNRDSVKSGATVEWFCDVPEIGRVRCLSFRDHRGPGIIIRMLPARAVSADQLGLSKDIQALSAQTDGLVLIAGPRASGKSTTLAAFVDLINRTRADHVITIERQVTFVHESQRAFVSQREVRGEAHEVLAAVRAALREDPDVLAVEELRSPEVVAAVLESAESGRLVLAGLRAPASAHAVERLMDQVPADRRPHALSALSTSLRGVISQVLLRRRSGGRVAARELLLNTPAAAAVLAEGKLFQLGAALESGRKVGSLPLNDTLAALIRDDVVDPAEAWRKAYDREGLLTLLKREGIDTSFVERLA